MQKNLIPILLLLLLISGCEGSGLFQKKVKIKGVIEKKAPKGGYKGFLLQDAKKVLIFYGIDYDLADINNDGTFTGKAPLGSATVVVFLTQNNEFIGNLYMKGLNFLPLNSSASANVSTIDLSTLTQDSTRIIPANDPIGTQIILSQKEIDFMREVGSYYEALSKNLDMNNDGTLDVFQHGSIDINTSQSFQSGIFGVNAVAPQLIPDTSIDFNFIIHAVGDNGWVDNPVDITAQNSIISGPLSIPYADIVNAGNSYFNNKEFKLNYKRNMPFSGNAPPFGPGEYTLHLDNREFTFHYSNISMVSYVVRVIPTFQTDANDMVTGISLEYKLLDGTPVNPKTLMISDIMVQVNGTSYQQLLEIRHEDIVPAGYDYSFITLPNPISLAQISGVNLLYVDLCGNDICNSWSSH